MDITFDIQNPKCDPEQLFKAFQRWSIKNRGRGFYLRDVRGWIWHLTRQNVYEFFIPSDEVISQLLTIWKEAGFIYEVYEDEKHPEQQLFHYTKISDTK
jgi:hypothetical protein